MPAGIGGRNSEKGVSAKSAAAPFLFWWGCVGQPEGTSKPQNKGCPPTKRGGLYEGNGEDEPEDESKPQEKGCPPKRRGGLYEGNGKPQDKGCPPTKRGGLYEGNGKPQDKGALAKFTKTLGIREWPLFQRV